MPIVKNNLEFAYFLTSSRRSLMTKLREIFLVNLKEARKAQNYSQSKLAEECDLSAGFIGEIEMGRRFPSLANLQKIADALNIKPYRLFLDVSDREDFNKVDLLNSLLKDLKVNISREIEETIKKYEDS